MTRFEFIDALREALTGLPPETIAATVAEYERRIRVASDAGQSEDDIMASLGDPQNIAAECRSARPATTTITVKRDEPPASFARTFFSFAGLTVFNLFLAIPAIAYCSLLFASFVLALACYGGGIAMTGASLAGVEGISFDRPDYPRFQIQRDAAGVPAAANGATPNPSAAANGSIQIADGTSKVEIGPRGVDVCDGSSRVRIGTDGDLPGLHIGNPGQDRDFYFDIGDVGQVRPMLVSIGIGLILAGIVAFLLCLVLARFTLVGIVRLAQMELSILKGA